MQIKMNTRLKVQIKAKTRLNIEMRRQMKIAMRLKMKMKLKMILSKMCPGRDRLRIESGPREMAEEVVIKFGRTTGPLPA
jgi:hypothetical protein